MKLLKIASLIISKNDDYEYSYDPEHKNKPKGSDWVETKSGWSKGKSESSSSTKIVDKNNIPKTMFRGITQNYDETKNPSIIWFTDDVELAKEYSEQGQLMKGNLICLNPFSFAKSEKPTTTRDCFGEFANLIGEHFYQNKITREKGLELIENLKQLDVDNKNIKLFQLWDEYPEVKHTLQMLGYDGIITEENKKQTVGIFNSEQFVPTF